MERTIRKQQKRILVDEATGDADKLQMDQIRLKWLNEEYKRFSTAADLPLQRKRVQVAGFGVKQARAVKRAYLQSQQDRKPVNITKLAKSKEFPLRIIYSVG
ncbi:MAG: hypothetical protein PUC59_00490 [Firmicutes bacterium]|nr:hypothetical protein [Bacillota bacterium]